MFDSMTQLLAKQPARVEQMQMGQPAPGDSSVVRDQPVRTAMR